MLETMYVRCTHCGYDNSPEYRFCGMCGASLAHPPAAPKPAEKKAADGGGNGNTAAPEKVHGPSFLGLAEDPKVEFHYLYEDEQPKSRVGLVVLLLIVFGGAGALGWQWRHDGFPFNRLGAGGQSASSSEVPTAESQDQQTHIDKPMTGAGDVSPTQTDQKPPDIGKNTETPVDNGQSGTQSNANGSAAGTPAAAASSNASANNPAGKASENKSAADNSSQTTEEAKATPPAVPTPARTPKVAARTPKPTPSQPAAVPGSADADLELAGERYLYGNGLPQNCTRAESNLRTAATHGNTKAETVLGTMYATGHCVGRDLPTAYRWFARALHQEPQNSRISDDLRVLWRQMTPQEKQLATASGQ
jgi:zinc-ribbon domain/Sel1 repeat